MNIIKASHRIVRATPDGLNAIEEAARVCYLSEPKDSPELRADFAQTHEYPLGYKLQFYFEKFVQDKFIAGLIKKKHITPFEFMDIEIEFICDRGVSHEAVRHRLTSPMQESTRYCNYSEDGKHNGITLINPLFFDEDGKKVLVTNHKGCGELLNKFDVWLRCMSMADWGYQALLSMGASPQEARSVLPNSLKTKLKIKANVREWWHIFNLRAINSGAHPQIREVMIPALVECQERWGLLFNHIR